jgi:hypothetical protein
MRVYSSALLHIPASELVGVVLPDVRDELRVRDRLRLVALSSNIAGDLP